MTAYRTKDCMSCGCERVLCSDQFEEKDAEIASLKAALEKLLFAVARLNMEDQIDGYYMISDRDMSRLLKAYAKASKAPTFKDESGAP